MSEPPPRPTVEEIQNLMIQYGLLPENVMRDTAAARDAQFPPTASAAANTTANASNPASARPVNQVPSPQDLVSEELMREVRWCPPAVQPKT